MHKRLVIPEATCKEKWPRGIEQPDKWLTCSTPAMTTTAEGAIHASQTTPQPLAGIQVQGGADSAKGDKPLAELAEQIDVHPNQITPWKGQLLERTATTFGGGQPTETPVDLKTLHARIGKLTLENGFSEHALVKAGGFHARR